MAGCLISYTVNIHRAKSYDIPDNDPRVQNERYKRKAGAIATAVGAAYIFKKTKDGVKDIMNPDGWKKIK